MTDDRLSTALEEIRGRSERPLGPSAMALPITSPAVRGLLESAGDVPRLLAALDAALKLPDRWNAPSALGASVLEEDRMWVRQGCAEDLRATITRALLGEDDANG